MSQDTPESTTPAGDGAVTADPVTEEPATGAPARKTAAKKTAKKAPAKKTAGKTAAKKTAKKSTTKAAAADEPLPEVPAGAEAAAGDQPAKKTAAKATAKKSTTRKSAAKKSTSKKAAPAEPTAAEGASATEAEAAAAAETAATALLFQAPEATAPARKSASRAKSGKAKKSAAPGEAGEQTPAAEEPTAEEPTAEEHTAEEPTDAAETDESAGETGEGEGGGSSSSRRRRRRGGRRRRKPGEGGEGGEGGESAEGAEGADESDAAAAARDAATDSGDGEAKDEEGGGSSSSRRRRRRRRSGDDGDGSGGDDPANTVTRVRQRRAAEDQITAVSGSTRLEAKKQRRREGREAGRRRAPIVSEAEFLARREAVDRVMVIRQRDELTQIAVLEDKVLVEHYVARESQTSLIGNVYLGRVQNVLPSMEAAFVDIGKGRNAVLYAGEVNWQALGHRDGQPRKIESVLSSGQSVLVQVTKDPVGHKGARLTSQISLAGRFLVYVPDGTTSGISRKLPDTERNRLKALLKDIVPDTAGVIVRTAAEGAAEDELTRDVERLKARWEDIEKKAKGSAPQLLYGEPDLTLKVVRDLFTEDFSKLVIEGDEAWETVQSYVQHVAPDLEERLERFSPDNGRDAFATYRIDEQIAKGLDRKVWLPSGGSLVIDRTEAMTVVDVNTGKFTGSGGNLEETVTKNNLEAAEEIVRQLRLRDIGGIIVVDFIDMVLESNRDLVLRRLVECLGRDRTRHQVAEVTSLGLVQMTRKRIGTGLLEAFSETCDHCQGRGVLVRETPVEPRKGDDEPRRSSSRRRGGRGRGENDDNGAGRPGDKQEAKAPSPADVAAMAREHAAETSGTPADETPADETAADETAADETPADETAGTEATGTDTAAPEAPAEETPAEPAPAVEQEPAAEPVEEPAVEELASPEPPAPPSKPTVVTRTRRRSASRPAGPPAGADTPASEPVTSGQIGAPVESGAVEPGTAVAVEHVPVKKKGSRKR
ncbi:Rne/Rng family ribonuclease [Nocardioides taihuensis]|uniref:Rne/Rng family ribonuclease n=1 Tax=Nocardioides taihuensis TaxID=1835606 RepID=A0ABW0BRN1_9ACTN